jgi:hypothetical protein
MDQTPRLTLSYVMPQQAQKHVSVNESLRRLDLLVQASVKSRTTTAQPANPADGDAYVLPSGKTGAAWSSMAIGAVAAFQDGAWTEYAPREGWRIWVEDSNEARVYDGADWAVYGSGGGSDTAPKFGVNTTADTTNKLSVKSNAVLFSHDDVTPGTGDARQIINKSAAARTASVIFQTGYSGRAEFGCVGDDQFRLKLSPDGSAWKDAFVIDRTSANVGIGGAPFAKLSVLGDNVSDPQVGDIHIRKEGYFAIAFLDSFAAAAQPFMGFRRARGTIASPAAVQNGDSIGAFGFRGYAPSGAFVQTAVIVASVDAAPSGASVPQALVFYTGTSGAVERLRINSGGDIGVGITTPTAKLDVDGAVKVKSFTVAGVPSASGHGAGAMIYVSNESGGGVLAFSDGANWRRVTDRAIIS